MAEDLRDTSVAEKQGGGPDFAGSKTPQKNVYRAVKIILKNENEKEFKSEIFFLKCKWLVWYK
jgi:hypothetical protein